MFTVKEDTTLVGVSELRSGIDKILEKTKNGLVVIENDFKKISKKDQTIIIKTIYKKLSTFPEKYGEPPRHNLKGYWISTGTFISW